MNSERKSVESSVLGKHTCYPLHYDATLLFPIARKESRSNLTYTDELPFSGFDEWTVYELSWLNVYGLPQVAVAILRINSCSEYIVESKSLKLYFNSLNDTVFDSKHALQKVIQRDLAKVTGDGSVEVTLLNLDDKKLHQLKQIPGKCLDDLKVSIDAYQPNSSLLSVDSSISVQNATLYSHLLKTNCPVTGQPDWASIFIEYTGSEIVAESLVKYIVSFRNHQDFHEHCVEKIFCDIQQRCQPDMLCIYARYTRRGGLDINPIRCSHIINQDNLSSDLWSLIAQDFGARTVRQ